MGVTLVARYPYPDIINPISAARMYVIGSTSYLLAVIGTGQPPGGESGQCLKSKSILGVSSGPEARQEGQDDECQDRTQHGRRFPPHARRNANCSRQPEACGGRQAVNLLRLMLLEDSPSPQEPNTGDDSLEDTAQIPKRHPGLVWNQDKEGRAKGDEHVGAEPCLFPDPLSLEPQEATKQRREQQTHNYLGDRRHPWQIGKICLYTSPHLLPHSVYRLPSWEKWTSSGNSSWTTQEAIGRPPRRNTLRSPPTHDD